MCFSCHFFFPEVPSQPEIKKPRASWTIFPKRLAASELPHDLTRVKDLRSEYRKGKRWVLLIRLMVLSL